MIQEFFNRFELKYLIHWNMYEELIYELKKYTFVDNNGDNDGRYKIISLYYDTDDYKFYFEKVNGIKFRQKLRLRIYNSATLNDFAFLEIKQKYNQVVNKRRTRIKLKHAYSFLQEDYLQSEGIVYEASNMQVMKEIDFLKKTYELSPKAIVSYYRQALQGIYEDDLRITFDTNLKCRDYNLKVEEGAEGVFFIDPQFVVMEIKVNDRIPLWLVQVLSDFNIRMQRISKYCSGINRIISSIAI